MCTNANFKSEFEPFTYGRVYFDSSGNGNIMNIATLLFFCFIHPLRAFPHVSTLLLYDQMLSTVMTVSTVYVKICMHGWKASLCLYMCSK